MFFKKAVIDENTRLQYAREIDDLIGQGKSKEAHAILQMYDKMNRQLGKAMQNRLRGGELPQLALDYLSDRVPGIEENKTFADYLARVKSGEAVTGQKASGTAKKKGLFGKFF